MSRYNVTYGGVRIQLEERQEKQVPFTITTIDDKDELITWRKEQQRKEEIWQAGASARLQKHIDRIADGSYLNNKETVNDRADKKWEELRWQKSVDFKTWPNQFPKVKERNQTLMEKAVSWFLNLKF